MAYGERLFQMIQQLGQQQLVLVRHFLKREFASTFWVLLQN